MSIRVAPSAAARPRPSVRARPSARAGASLPEALILALGLLGAGGVLGAFFYAAQAPRGEVRVVGAATLPFVSDRVKWTMTLTRRVSPTDLLQGYTHVRDDVERIRGRLASGGIPTDELILQPVSSDQWFGEGGQVSAYVVRQVVSVVSERVDAVEALARDPSSILGEGMLLENSNLEYYYTGLTELKRSLLAEATADAEARAREIAGDDLGDLRDARAGVFQIREPYSTEVAGYGMYSTATRQKEITVTVHTTWELR